VIRILLGAIAFAGRLAPFLLFELLLEPLNLVSKRLPIGTERLDDVQQFLDRQLRLDRQIPSQRQKVLDLFQYLSNAGTAHAPIVRNRQPRQLLAIEKIPETLLYDLAKKLPVPACASRGRARVP